jgi:imidazolonepropionase-like amidohydrolase
MKREQDYGSLQAGRKADLVIVEGDPLSDIRNLRKVKTVIKDGELYDPVALHKLVGFGN